MTWPVVLLLWAVAHEVEPIPSVNAVMNRPCLSCRCPGTQRSALPRVSTLVLSPILGAADDRFVTFLNKIPGNSFSLKTYSSPLRECELY